LWAAKLLETALELTEEGCWGVWTEVS
jgi:hypothetical protein